MSKPLPTLKGIFSVPKETHRRDFLRENKLSLRQLEKTTTQKLAAKEPIRPKWMPPEPPQAAHRRSMSEVSSEPRKPVEKRAVTHRRNDRSERAPTPDRRNGHKLDTVGARAPAGQLQKSIEIEHSQRDDNRCQSCGSERSIKGSSSSLCDKGMQTDEINDEMYLTTALRRCTGSQIVNSRLNEPHTYERRSLAKDHAEDTHSRIIQSESRCEVGSNYKQQSRNIVHDKNVAELEDDDYQGTNGIAADSRSIDSRYTIVPNDSLRKKSKSTCIENNGCDGVNKRSLKEGNPSISQSRSSLRSKQHFSNERLDEDHDANGNEYNRQRSPSMRSQVSIKTKRRYKSKTEMDGDDDDVELSPTRCSINSNKMSYRARPGDSDDDDVDDAMSQRLHNLDLDPELNGYRERCVDNYEHGGDGDHLSIHSRQTLRSNVSVGTNASKRRPHKLGSLDEVRLPRYLEREKRVKEEEKLREQQRDPDCPANHILLTETERIEALAAAKKKYDGLVNELNHMPMTTQTLRVRTRRAEIDKELTVVEDDIRIFSKPKVYVKCDQF